MMVFDYKERVVTIYIYEKKTELSVYKVLIAVFWSYIVREMSYMIGIVIEIYLLQHQTWGVEKQE